MASEKFIKRTGIQRGITENILDTIFQNVEWKQSDCLEILDVGCGPGNVTKEILVPKLPWNFKKLIGIDIRDDFLTYAERNYGDDRMEFIKMDIEEGVPPEYEGRFDLVTSFYCIHLLKNPKKAIEIIGKCIRPGGHFILSFQHHTYLDDFFYKMSQDSKWAAYVGTPGSTLKQKHDWKQEIFTYLQNKGFNVIYDDQKQCETTLNRTKHIEFLKKYNPYHIPIEKQEEYFSYVIDNYLNEGLTADQANNIETFASKYTLMIIFGQKVR